ncbi:Baculoviral IAP repeat-containing protein 6 [Sciurus carolinensis]|uniref:Baculoviral IAP repeat-containing protein 6 n=1 Tax=Sciurus carolinensis TaxID=30640 RepID=A0AA41SUE7_SCICA|nr:Baculoviral IAP repeat-containing protein 6 [Sciurus carolinensis]
MAAAAAAASGPGCSSAAGAGAAGVSEWLVLRDGCMRCDADGLHSLSYHPALNAILAVTSRGTIKVIDGTSGATLQASALSAKPGGQVKCQYISAVDKVIFVDDYAVGCRKDLNGILLLDTALQTPVSKQDDVVQLELPVTEAQQLLSACIEKVDVSSTEGYDLFITQLKDGLKNTSHETAANHKVAKWATVTFHLPHHVLKSIASAIVNELKKINQNVAALPVASSVMDRLSYLLPSARPELGVGPGRSVDRSEHERHSPNCPFVKGEHTQNVPLSVTLATSPAQFPCTDGTDRISCFGSGSCPHFLAAATKRGKICIWDVSKLMKVHLKFEINAYDPAIVQQLILSGEPSSGVDSRRPTLAWLEDSSSCSDIPKLEGDSDDLLEDSDSEEHSRSDSVTGHTSQKEAMEVSLDITALSILQQPEKLQWEIVANVLEDTVKDLEELGANPCLTNSKSEKTKEKHQEQHNIPFPCLLAGGLLTYKSPATSPISSNSHRSLDGLSRTQGESISEQGSTDNESCTNSELNSPLVRRTLPVLLLYSIKESDEKAGKIFSQMNNIMSKSLHDDGFTVPQIIEMELDSQEQLLLQDPPVTYIQQFADAAANLTSPDSEKWNSVFPKPGTLVQCLRLPRFAEEENLCIDSITPCADGIHLLVGLRTCPVESLSAINQVEALNNLNKLNSALCNRRKGELESNLAVVNGANISVIQHEPPADVQTPLIIQPEQRNVSGGYLVLYKMNYATRIVTLEEEPIKIQHIKDPQDTITSLILLPPDILDNREDDCEEPVEEMQLTSKNGIEREKKSDISTLGHLVITTQGGYVKILDLSNFEILAKVEPPKKEGTEEQDAFVSVIYCSGTDRLCACTKGGELHFLQIGGTCDDIDEADILVDGSLSKGIEPSSEGSKPLSNPSSPGISGVDLLVDQPFTLEILTSLVELTRFETLTPRFSATVPPCWVEVQQEQQQRRHPQHLHQQHHGDAAQHTRTWKLQTDSNSWDEHVFELVLPKACMVGHVDFKFVLNSNITNIPQIQVTLLKNKAPGLGKVNALNIEVEQNGKPSLVDLNEEMQHMDVEESQCLRLCPFLEDHKEDILCGPVWLASGLDLSGHAGMLTLTSPKLVKGMAGGKYRSFLIHVKAVNERATDEICNGGIRPVVRLPSLKHQSNKGYSLASLLAKVAAGKEKSSNVKNENAGSTRKSENLRGCDLLQEVSVTIRRFKKTSISKESSKEGNESLLSKTRKCLSDIVRVCFFEAGRSIAHKCARFLALCISNGKCDPCQPGFGSVLLKALLDNMSFLPAAATGGSVYWYFVLLNYVKDEDLAGCSTACASLLTAVSRQLQDRLTPMEALLQTRYGLYSSPFDPVLFDLEMSGSSCKNVYNSSIGVQSDEIDLSDVLSGNGKVSSCTAAEGSFTSLTGLLEVEPLHFTCVSTSDGTRIERDDAMSSFGVTPAVGGLSSGTVGEASTALSSAAQVALQSLSHAMASAEQQLQVLQEKQQQLLKLQQQKAKLEAKLHQTTAAAAAAASAASAVGPVHNSVPSNPVAAPGFFIHPSDVIPPTPKTTPLFMTPPLTPPNEAVSVVINAELAQLFPGSVIDPPTVNLAAHNKNSNKSRMNPLGSGLALAISHASHFLQPPPHQSIIIERMHSGARRFVTLDFGRPILLTDVLIPTCGDLASLSIDIWTLGEEVDGRRLVVATDISTHSLILHDLIPPPVCRFMKITVIGRYGSTNARAKIPLGFYYGHTYILPWESELKLMHDPLRGEGESANQPDIDQHLAMMVALQEDIQCRYNLACHRLETLLQSIDLPPLNSANNAQYFLRKPDKAVEEDSRVFSAYQDCIQLQLQLNLAHNAVQRLKVAIGASRKTLNETSNPEDLIQMSSTEQLRTIIRYLLDTLLSLLHSSNGVLDIPMISWVVMLVSRLLDYVATVEDEAAAAKKPLNGKDRERFLTGNQWSFINNNLHTQSLNRSSKGSSSLDRLYSRKIRKQLVHHKQQLNLLKAKQKALVEQMEKEKIQSNKGSSYKLLVEQAKLKQATSKHFKDLLRLRRTAEWSRSNLDTEVTTTKESPEIEPLPFTLAHERCISVVQKLVLFLLSMDFTCHADLLLFVCKVLARIANATRPTIHLCEIVNEPQLERLLLLLVGTDFNRGDISWGGAWAQYSLTCMLQDILAGELLAPVAAEAMEEGAVGDDVGATAGDSDDSLQQSSVQLLETIDEPLTHDLTGTPPLSSLEKDKEIDLELLQDLMEVDIDPLDIDLEKDPLAAKVFKPISSTWYDYWGADYCTYNYNPYIGGLGIPVAKPPANTEKNGSQTVSVSVSQALDARLEVGLEQQAELMLKMMSTLEADSILQALTNTSPTSGSSSAIGTQESTAHLLVSDPNLIHVLVKFLSGTSPHGTNQHSPQVGPTATQAMQEFLTRLQVHLSSTCPQIFSEFLLKLIHILSTERGAFQTGQGPLDAQVKLLEFTLEQNFEVVSVSIISAVIESVTFLVHHYITCSDKVMSRSGSDSSVGARACFGGLFANLIRPGDAKAVCGEMTRDQLMFDLLKLVNILVQLPLSGNREYSARVSVTSNTTDSVSDEEKVSGGKDVNGSSTNMPGSPAYVADLVLANQQIMSQILSALGLCNSSAMAMIIGASGLHLTKHENFHGGLDAISVGDGLFTILTTLSKKASTVHMMLQPILTYMACGYMGRQGSLATCQLSEPLLWFILRVLDTSDALKAFHDMGGVQLICNNMVTSTRAIVNTARSMVSTIMKFLDCGPNKAVDSTLKTRILASEPDNAEGIHNFAPLGTITSSSPTAQPAEVLLQATPPHRRARSAAWSYIFLPEEAWCDLTIHLPAAVLLKEIHIQPHLASLATCPSSVSVEVSADGVNMLPLSTPVVTSGLTYIKIQLVKAEVASAVCLRLHRPRDASTLGLSQIKLLGLTAFGTTSSATVNNPFLPSEDQVSKTSIGWLRLLHHCLTHISDLEGMMASAAAPTANLLQTCAALLMSPYCGMHSPNIEVVLVKIGLQSTRIGLKLIDILLRNCAASGSDPTDLNSPLLFGRLNGLSSDSTIDILYQLGTTQDPGTKDRIQALLKWVSDSARVAAMKRSGRMNYLCPSSSTIEYGLLMPSPSHLHCVAAILWHSYELLVEYDLPALLDRELFELLFNWSMSLPCNMVLKKAVDSLLCSMCHIHPNYFSLLMGWMGITPPPVQCHHSLSMTDDSKKQDLSASLTDDSKNAQAPLALTESHLATLASSSQSPEAIKQLLDSGLPSLLVRSLASFCFSHISYSESIAQSIDISQDKLRRHHVPQHCNKMPITADLIAPILRFLTEVGNSHIMKDWLGGSEVNPLWTALLFLLCHSGSTSGGHNLGAQQTNARSVSLSSAATTGLTTQQRTAIENATVAFFLQCISCHPNNQKLMAQVLCELFQTSPQRGNLPTSGNISGFIRRLFLQLMLEDEKVTMFLQSPCPLYKGRINATSHVIQHPMYGAGHKFRTLHLPVSTTLSDVLDRVSGKSDLNTPSITAKLISEQKDDKEKKNHEEKEKVKAENGFQDNYSVVVASGLKSQSKRAVSATPPRPPSRRGRTIPDKIGSASSGAEAANKIITVPVFHLFHKLLAGQPLPAEMTLAQLLTLLYDRKLPQGYRSIDLTVKLGSRVITDPSLSKTDSFKRLHPEKDHGDLLGSCPEDEALTPSDECLDGILDESLLETCPIQSPLQVFAGMGGLALIAERLPMLYPEVIQQVSAPVVTSTTQEKPKDSDQFEWVTIEQSGELVYEAPETIAAEPPPIKSAVQTMSPIPAHSLAAFGLFLRLPGYAEVLLKERKHAQCLLRLVLGVTDDGEGSHILQSPSANVLPTLPFHVLRSLFSTTPLTTDDGVLLRRMALEIGALHLILVCLSALSHHAPRVPNSSLNQTEPQVSSSHNPTSTEEQQLYWAKGTGFGTGSTASGWDVEQALTKQRLEEEHVTCLLQVLASYINPVSGAVNGEAQSSHESRGQNSNALPSVLLELLSQSCLIPAMSSYLRNDSVLDMARHVPLYRALLELLRAIASCTTMVPLLLPLSTESGEEEEEQSECQTSVGTLLAKMKTCVDTYTNRLRSKRENVKTGVKPDASDQEPEGLTLLVPDIQKTAEIVYTATTSLRQANQEKKLGEYSKKVAMKPKPLSVLKSLEEKYVAVMKKLQFDTFEMVSEDEDGKLGFKVNYHYMSQVKNANDANSAARARRLAQEAVTLSTSLPLSSSSSVFVRCDEERLDIMKVLITGPADTPYANGCFEFDVYFPQDYPSSPPLVNLETTGGHSVRFNPNLYNDGKVCLSILNTWHGRPEEKWNPQTSSFLQVLVSVQSLILVAEPYFNEPGYERSRGTPSGTQSSREYDGNIRQATVKWAMLEQIRNPSPCFKEVIHKHFYLKRVEIMAQCEEWIADIQQYSSDKRVGRTMSHHAAALKRHTAQLREELLKLPCPEGLDPDIADASEVCRATAGAEDVLTHDQVKASSSRDLSSDFQL